MFFFPFLSFLLCPIFKIPSHLCLFLVYLLPSLCPFLHTLFFVSFFPSFCPLVLLHFVLSFLSLFFCGSFIFFFENFLFFLCLSLYSYMHFFPFRRSFMDLCRSFFTAHLVSNPSLFLAYFIPSIHLDLRSCSVLSFLPSILELILLTYQPVVSGGSKSKASSLEKHLH